jgi:sigma-B regulation protein RsbU (phosphoserine phosphatase)
MLTTSVAVSTCEWHAELQKAHAIQQHLLDKRDSRPVAHVDSRAVCRQAQAVGGDFYDLLRLPNGELGVAIADVAGKGLGAAILAANLQATLGTEARRAPSDLVNVISSVNHRFHEASFEESYATLFYATFSPASRILKYVNAGHNPPLLRRADGSIEWLETGGAPVGMFHSSPYGVGSLRLNPGDVLVAYTDGIVEAQDALAEQWGARRLVEVVDESRDEMAAQINARIWKAVDRFVGRADQRDDMTLLVLRVTRI